jgi:hypothetical protein
MNGHNDRIHASIRKLAAPPCEEGPENISRFEITIEKIQLSTGSMIRIALIFALLVAALVAGKCRR